MRPHLVLAVLALGGLTGFAPAPLPRPHRPGDPQRLLEQMQGSWQIVSAVRGGLKSKLSSSRLTRIRIEGHTWTVLSQLSARRNGTGITYTIQLDTTKQPATMDLIRQRDQVPWMRGVLTLEGDTLKWCYVIGSQASRSARPNRFDPVPDGTILMTLQRVNSEPRGARR